MTTASGSFRSLFQVLQQHAAWASGAPDAKLARVNLPMNQPRLIQLGLRLSF